MKKVVLIALIVVVMVVVIGRVIFINLNNKEKTSITASSFYTTMSQKGYIVQDASSQYANYDYVKQVYIATSEDYSYQIKFYELLNDSYAISFYNNIKPIFGSSKGNAPVATNVALNNYSKYTLPLNGKYMVISRINNTIIYVDVDDNYKDTVKSILDELGY